MDKKNSETTDDNKSLDDTECSICLQSFVQPVQLPCKHTFCFLCVKGMAQQNNKCALCRKVIPQKILNNPQLVVDQSRTQVSSNSYRWFYEGKLGWWQYDDRTSADMEAAHQNNEFFEVLIAGNLYVIDFQRSVQFKKSNPGCRRRIKRDLVTVSKKGVAGIYQKCDSATINCSPSCSSSVADSCSTKATSSSSNDITGSSSNDTTSSSSNNTSIIFHAAGNLVNLDNAPDASICNSDVVVLSECTTSKPFSQVNTNDQSSAILTVEDDNDTVPYNAPTSSKKRKRTESSGILPNTEQRLEMKDEVHNAFGVVVVAKLQAMSNVQRIIAEKIINDTLFQGLLGKLTPDTNFTVPAP